MMNWAKYLRDDSKKHGYKVMDNTNMAQEESRDRLLSILNEQRK